MKSWVVDRDSTQASRAFAVGMQLCLCNRGNEGLLSETPEFAEHVSRLAKLRKQTADRTVHARFRDNQGLTVKTASEAGAYTFEGQDGKGPGTWEQGPGGTATGNGPGMIRRWLTGGL